MEEHDNNSAGVGRPHVYFFDLEDITKKRQIGLSWSKIAQQYKCHRNTLFDWRRNVNFLDPGTVFSQEVLDEGVYNYVIGHPQRGEQMIIGHLRSIGLHVIRSAVREAIERIDPEGKQV